MGLNDFILNCEKENLKLKEDIEYYKNKSKRLEQQLKQKDDVIDEVRKFVYKKRYQPSPLGFELELNPSELWQLLNILNKRGGTDE